MKPLFIVFALITTVLLTGCGESRVTYNESELPEWVANPHLNGFIGGQGSARPSRGGFGETIAEAEANARTELARSLQVQVKSAFTHYFSEGGQADSFNKWSEQAEELTENFGKQISDVMLELTHRQKIWTHPETNELFVWVVLRDEYKQDAVAKIKALAKERVHRAKLAADMKSQEALQRLDQEIDKRLNPSTNGVQVVQHKVEEAGNTVKKL